MTMASAAEGVGGGRYRPRRGVAIVEDADIDLSCQPRLPHREHSAGARVTGRPIRLFSLKHPMVVGLTTNADRLVQIRRNRLLSLNQAPETSYVDQGQVSDELAYARRMFADNDWPVIEVTRRSIEETAAAIINLHQDRQERAQS